MKNHCIENLDRQVACLSITHPHLGFKDILCKNCQMILQAVCAPSVADHLTLDEVREKYPCSANKPSNRKLVGLVPKLSEMKDENWSNGIHFYSKDACTLNWDDGIIRFGSEGYQYAVFGGFVSLEPGLLTYVWFDLDDPSDGLKASNDPDEASHGWVLCTAFPATHKGAKHASFVRNQGMNPQAVGLTKRQ